MEEYEQSLIILGFLIGILISIGIILFVGLFAEPTAEFVCESHGLELIDYEVVNLTFSKVECGNKKPELHYDNYKVFTK